MRNGRVKSVSYKSGRSVKSLVSFFRAKVCRQRQKKPDGKMHPRIRVLWCSQTTYESKWKLKAELHTQCFLCAFHCAMQRLFSICFRMFFVHTMFPQPNSHKIVPENCYRGCRAQLKQSECCCQIYLAVSQPSNARKHDLHSSRLRPRSTVCVSF